MTNILNNPGCGTITTNTGVPGCAFIPKNIVGCILIDKSKVFTLTTKAQFLTDLTAACLALGAARAFPIGPFEEFKDNSGAASFVELGYGSKQLGKEGKYDLDFRFFKGGHCYLSRLRLFNGDPGKKVLWIDKDGVIMGAKVGAATDKITGMAMDYFYADKMKLDDGAGKPAEFHIQIGLSEPKEFNEELAYIPMDDPPLDAIKGNIDVEVYLISQAAGKATVGVRTLCDKVDLYPIFKTALAAAAAWIVTKAGVAVIPTSVAGNDVASGWDINLTTPAGAHLINLAAASVLAATPIFMGGTPDNGYESTGTITVTW